jgi:hypothetical protein
VLSSRPRAGIAVCTGDAASTAVDITTEYRSKSPAAHGGAFSCLWTGLEDAILATAKWEERMAFVYDFLILLIWTAMCAAFVAGLEYVLELLGYRAEPVDVEHEHVTSTPED